ncbi:hypothetical protein ACIA58_06280 [Kribbella sp. NPDC051586]|uniref:hypothetical protein n=1 Tax=Kribbella sp. NPDC051586 TaxID=3364118 RepID=UPI003794A1D3
MEHPSSLDPTPPVGDSSTFGNTSADAARRRPTATIAERQARANWLITELSRLAADADDPRDGARFRRTADSLVRLSAAFRS